ncbi:hypothetical protein [Thermococcus aciditolerans]|nr:hypothetical protein [Thermococcus aciditolerans]
MVYWLTLMALGGGELVVNKAGMRKDLLAWHLQEVRELASEYDSAFQVLLELLSDDNPHVRANALQVLLDMVGEEGLSQSRLSAALDGIISLTRDDNERVALKALEVLNALLERGQLTEEEYGRITDALMDVIKSGIPILSEYASEGLGKVGAKFAKLAYRLIGWLFSLIGSSKKREVQGAAITALTEMASKTEDTKVLNEVFDKMADLLSHPDPYVVERAVMSMDRLLSRSDKLSMRNKLKAINGIKRLRGDVKLGIRAAQVLEKLEKSAGVDKAIKDTEDLTKSMTASQYSAKDIDRLLDAGKPEIVAELAKMDPEVMGRVLGMLEDEDYTRRMDALWIVSRLAQYLTPSDAYSILPVLGEFLKSKNPWARETAAEVLADIYTLYPGTQKFFASLLNVLLKSTHPRDIEGALELLSRITDKVQDEAFLRSTMGVMFQLLERDDARGVVLRFLAREAQRLVDLDEELLFELKDRLKTVYGMDGGKYDEIIASLIDVIDDILRLRQSGVVVHT